MRFQIRDTGVILFNHALHDYNEYFDPKIDDTLIINENIKSQLLERHPENGPRKILSVLLEASQGAES